VELIHRLDLFAKFVALWRDYHFVALWRDYHYAPVGRGNEWFTRFLPSGGRASRSSEYT
jgi:hypothetical protein